MTNYNTIATLSNSDSNYIVLDKYVSHFVDRPTSYQTEAQLEEELIQDLTAQGYEYLPSVKTSADLLQNLRSQMERLNDVRFSDEDWQRFLVEYLDKPNETSLDKARKLHEDNRYDFTFADGHRQNLCLVDKKNLARNSLQVIRQMEQTGTHTNRYDVTILVNGLPLVQIELKRRGVAIREAFNQIHRYSKESFNAESSLYKYLQLCVISNGTDTRYFANTTKREASSFDFTMNWAEADNTPIRDLRDFTATFFESRTLLSVLLTYSVFNTEQKLLIMRPYQIAATERILWKIQSSYASKVNSSTNAGGYIWHTTGSGKTLTSFKAAQLATGLDFIDKVFFVVDRKDLDYQTMKEYQRFSPDSVNGSKSSAELRRNIEKNDGKIIVTTIQKLNDLVKKCDSLPIYDKHVVFIFDECHRSQFGESQRNIRRRFKKYYQFGFTGTPIFAENASGEDTTEGTFGDRLHSYTITDAIRDEKVLKFKVDYNDVRPAFHEAETEQDEVKQQSSEVKRQLLHPERIREISQYILRNYSTKTHRGQDPKQGFNAMFAVSSIEAARLYYETFQELQAGSERPLRIATIFSYAANEEQAGYSLELEDEDFSPEGLSESNKEFLGRVMQDYNAAFKTNFSVEAGEFQNYYKDLSQRMKNEKEREVDLLIVVGMFLTGFDAPYLNTLFVDKNLRYHGLIQAFSRTNRILNATKTFGNIVCFRNLEEATETAIRLFGDKGEGNIILEKSFKEFLHGFEDHSTGKTEEGYIAVVQQLQEQFPNPGTIQDEGEEARKSFAQLFGKYLKLEHILQNYDEHAALKELQQIDPEDKPRQLEVQQKYGLSSEDMAQLRALQTVPERLVQDYRSAYNDLRERKKQEAQSSGTKQSSDLWDDVVFEVDLLKSQEVNLDYILGLIFDYYKQSGDKEALLEEIRRIIRSSLENRAKESLVLDFIESIDLSSLRSKDDVIDRFYQYAQEKKTQEAESLIQEEGLRPDEAKHYLEVSLRRGYPSENGEDLSNALPRMSPLTPGYTGKRKSVLGRIATFVEKFRGIGGDLLKR